MDYNIENLETWAEAERWLSKHGYGLGQINEIKLEWEAAKAPKSVVASPAPQIQKVMDTPQKKVIESPTKK
mgnify:CR=1 FL=1